MKILILFFSRADENYNVGYISKGNTEIIAEYIRETVGGDMFRVDPLIPYSKEYGTCIEEAKIRSRMHNAPIKEDIPDIAEYDVIYIGSPVYWGGMPEEMFTALKGKDFTGKTVYPFVTHEGSGLSSIPAQIRALCPLAKVEPGLAVQGSMARKAKKKVVDWLSGKY